MRRRNKGKDITAYISALRFYGAHGMLSDDG